MVRWGRLLGWWIADYGYAAYWQARGVVAGRSLGRYGTGELRPVIVLPGIWETWGFMLPIVDELHRAGHPVFAITDLRRNAGTVVASAGLVARFIVERDLHDVLIVAHSKGGLIGKYAMALLDDERRISSMVAVSSPFAGSRYATHLPLPSLRALSPRDATTRMLAGSLEVNARTTSVYAQFDPHIPEGSELAGARNVELATGGHFRTLAAPQTVALVLAAAAAAPGSGAGASEDAGAGEGEGEGASEGADA
ncbi:esterase/lipase family protein [Subtercola sp. YIM 133946]|uniref:esterase/lipase family protein n=1 Tax=Subtercola sp. YIM 133946 TaxID=3118909 RepID=UPI002F928F52